MSAYVVVGHLDFGMQEGDVSCESSNGVKDEILIFDVVFSFIGERLLRSLVLLGVQAIDRFDGKS